MNIPRKHTESGPLVNVWRAINEVIDYCVSTRPAKGRNVQLKQTSSGTIINAEKGKTTVGESAKLQFKGEWDRHIAYDKGDIVIRGSNNVSSASINDATNILRNGHIAGVFIALVDIPAADPLEDNVAPAEPPESSSQWETFSRGAWHTLAIRPIDPTKNYGVQIESSISGTFISITGANNKSCVIDTDNPINPLKANASWVEIDVCENGVAKKMQVLGTAPYIS